MSSPENKETSPAPLDHAEAFAAALTRGALRRRITVLVAVMSIVVVGTVAMLQIPLELFPRGYTGHNLHVWVPWPDAPVQEVLNKITLPLEEELSTVRGLDGINSWSSRSGAGTFLRFKRGTDMDVAYREVRDRVQRARFLFPADVDRVFIRKDDASQIPVAVIGMAIDPSLTDYYTLVRKQIVQRIERIDGVANVQTDGLEEKEILIEVDRQRAESSGLNLYEISKELEGDNFTMASGHVRDGGRKFLLRSLAQYRSVEEIENLPLSPSVRVRDVATIKLEEPDKRYAVRVNGRPAVALVIFKEGEANTVEVSRRIAQEFERMQKDPRLASMYMEMLFNQGAVVEESLGNLAEGGMIGAVLAAAVLFFFLRRVRLTAIVTLSIPLSLLMALATMYFSGESLNILTILALVIAIGMLVDNSIVVAENIHLHHREGRSRREACIQGAGEIALAITMATLTTVIVFVPAALVEGEGQFFMIRLALPISISLIASLLVAVVFIPLSVFITLPRRSDEGTGTSWWQRMHARMNTLLERAYECSLGWTNRLYVRWLAFFLRHRLDLVILLAALFAITCWAGKRLELVAQQEEDRTGFDLNFEASSEYTFEDLGKYFREIEQILEARKEEYGLKAYFVFYRQRGGRVEGWFKEDRKLPFTAKEVAARLEKEIPRKPGIRVYHGDENRAEEERGDSVFVVHLEGDDAVELDAIAEKLEALFIDVPGVLGVRRGEEAAPSELALRIDRDRAAYAGVNPEAIAGLIGYALRGHLLPKYNDQGREIPVRIRFQESDRESLPELAGYQVPTAENSRLALSALIHPEIQSAPRGIFRRNKKTTRTITLELTPKDTGKVRDQLMSMQRSLALPEGVTIGASSYESVQQEMAAVMFAASLSVAFIYLLMGFLFESFILPLSIILTIPLAGLGVVWIHLLSGKDLDFLGIVGIVMLIGVVVNNGIVLVDYVNRLRQEGQSRLDALLHAAARRFRPILMTALTTIIGMLPLTVSEPNEIGLSYKSFGLTLVGGMTTATVLTLLVVPVFYTLFDDLRGILGGLRLTTTRNLKRESTTRSA